MFIKQTHLKRGQRTYTYHRLVESVRTSKGPRQRLVMSLGTLEVPKSDWPLLADRIEEFLKRQESLPFGSYAVDGLAREFAERIERKQLKKQSEASLRGEVGEVYLDKTDTDHSRELGPEYVGHSFWKRLGMDRILRELEFTEKQRLLCEVQVVGRLVCPRSELGTVGWFERTALGELMDGRLKGLNEDLLYRVSDKLYKKREEIEARVAQRERELFSLDETIILYDLTSTYFEGLALGNEKADYGYSRDHRPDQKQVVVGLVLDREGFPKAHTVFEGNKRDPETLAGMLDKLEKRVEEKRATVVMDRGLATEKNLEMVRRRGYTYIVVTRQSEREKWLPEIEKDQFVALRENEKGEVEVEGQVRRLEDEVVVLCYSKRREAKDGAIRERFRGRFEEDAGRLKKRVESGKLKDERKIHQAIGRLRERYPRVARYYDLELVAGENGRWEFRWAVKKEDVQKDEDRDGMYILRTNRLDLSDREIWSLYVMLTRIENSFRYMKSTLGIRPLFHQKAHRVESHIFISILAYHLLHAIERQLREHGDTRSWPTIRDILSTHDAVTIVHKGTNGKIYKIRKATKAERNHEEIYKRLRLSSTPLSVKKRM
jgi:transposase